VNEELRCELRNHPGIHEAEDRECFTPPREFSTPFSQSIMEAVIPHTFVGPKVTFTGMEDPEAHLTAFHTQMMLVGGSDVVRCKLFMSTLTGMAMNWFISLLDGHITSFAQLSQLFREQYIANRAPPPVSYDLFNVKQYQGETLKEYINHFGAQVVKVGTTEEPMIVYTFRKGMCPGPFCESIIRSRPRSFAKIRRRALEHIATEGEVCEKRTSVAPARARVPPSVRASHQQLLGVGPSVGRVGKKWVPEGLSGWVFYSRGPDSTRRGSGTRDADPWTSTHHLWWHLRRRRHCLSAQEVRAIG